MKARIKPAEKTEELLDYLKPRFEEVRKDGETIVLRVEDPEKLSFIPGIESFEADGEERDGIGGKPIHREAFMQVESREDAARAFLATLEGYRLYMATEREWDLRSLRRYSPEIVKAGKEVAETLEVEELNFETDLAKEELLDVYREFLTYSENLERT